MKKSLFKNSFYNITYQILSMLFPLITSVYASRIILDTGIGKVAYAQNITSYFIILATIVFPSYAIREVSKERDNREKKNVVFTELFIINFCATLVASCIFIYTLFYILGGTIDIRLYFATGLVLFFNIFNIDWFYQAEEEYGYITLRSFLIKIISLISLFIFVRSYDDYVNYALITSLGIVLNYMFNIIHVRNFTSIQFRGLDFKRHLRPLAILFFTYILATIYSKLDITMLGKISSDSTVAYYSNAQKIILIFLVACQSFTAVFLPRLSYLFKENEAELVKLLELGLKILLFITVPATVSLYLLSYNIIFVLYGDTFLESVLTLKILAPLLIIRAIGDLLCYQFLISIGKESKRVPAYMVAAIVNVVLNYILIPIYYHNGAAISFVTSEFLVNVIQLIFVLKIIDIKIDFDFIISTVISTLITASIVYFVTINLDNVFFALIVSVFLGTISYLLVNFILKNEVVCLIINKVTKQ